MHAILSLMKHCQASYTAFSAGIASSAQAVAIKPKIAAGYGDAANLSAYQCIP